MTQWHHSLARDEPETNYLIIGYGRGKCITYMMERTSVLVSHLAAVTNQLTQALGGKPMGKVRVRFKRHHHDIDIVFEVPHPIKRHPYYIADYVLRRLHGIFETMDSEVRNMDKLIRVLSKQEIDHEPRT